MKRASTSRTTRTGPRGTLGRAARAALLVLGAGGCGGESGDSPPERASGDETGAIVVPDTSAADSAGTAEDTEGPEDSILPPMPGEGDPREFRLLLVNLHDHPARVFASAGSARVALDTVPARDSALVDVRVRADRILLEAEDERGVGIGSIELDLLAGETNRWEIGPSPGPRVASAGPPTDRPVAWTGPPRLAGPILPRPPVRE